MAHTIDEDTKKIVKAIVHGDQKRQSRRRAGKHTDFDRKAAGEDIDPDLTGRGRPERLRGVRSISGSDRPEIY